jgi:hypothetical protein
MNSTSFQEVPKSDELFLLAMTDEGMGPSHHAAAVGLYVMGCVML